MNETREPVRAVLFDLGGVVLDVDFDRAFQHWARYSRMPVAELRRNFHVDEPYEHHETGRLDAEGYFAHLRQVLQLECNHEAIRAGYNAVLVAEIDETVRLLDAVRAKVPCYAISNTNAVHLAHIEQAFPQLLPRFARVFTSHEIGHRKPHAPAFEHVLREIRVRPGEALLFDDLVPNIEAARALGMQAVLVRGPEDVRAGLAERGLL
ncbi:MAG TPA: HAD family phosphatase [Ramlibacter sp.]|jgi:putative hydrolase of the HAD superfamily|nr:HAD family phosphatase [Ramlibacter sp.]